jgi:hypothetical protein
MEKMRVVKRNEATDRCIDTAQSADIPQKLEVNCDKVEREIMRKDLRKENGYGLLRIPSIFLFHF